MKWTLNSLRFSSRVSRISRCSFMRLLSLSRSFSASLSRSLSFRAGSLFLVFFLSLTPSHADTLSEADSGLPVESDTSTMQAVTNLARALSFSAASPATVEDNVAAILAFLNSGPLLTMPQWSRQVTTPISAGLANGLFASGYSARSIPSVQDSFLFKIFNELQVIRDSTTNSPSVDLSNIEDSLSSSLDYLSDFSPLLSSLESTLYLMSSVLENQGHDISAIQGHVSANTYGDHMWYSHLDENQINSLTKAIGDLSFDFDTAIENLIYQIQQNGADISGQLYPAMSNGLSSLVLNTGDIINALTNIQDVALDMRDGLGYEGTSRSVQLDFGYSSQSDPSRSLARDLRFLQQQFGFESPSPSNNLAFLLRSMLDSAPAQSLVASMSNEVASVTSKAKDVEAESETLASNTVAVAESEEPDWTENRFTGDNPIEGTSSSLETAAKSIISRMTPALPESASSDKEIVLFRGSFPVLGGRSSSRSSSVNLNIAYPLVDHDEVSSGLNIMRSIMEVVWSFITVLICGAFILRFWSHAAKIASGIASGHFEESGSLDGWL